MPSAREAGRAYLELAGLWAVAIAWPVYEAIASGPEALTGLGARRLDLIVLVLLWSLLVPGVLLASEVLVGRLLSTRARLLAHAGLLGTLAGLVVWQWLTKEGLPGALSGLALIATAAGCAALYLRYEAARTFAGVLAFATPVVIVAFALSDPIRDEVLPHEALPQDSTIEADVPVVMIILDELPAALLEDRRGRLDSALFPNLAQLAGSASRYRRAFSVADQTTYAVPSILTGEDPYDGPATEVPAPGRSEYPVNVCTLAAAGGYEVHAYEPITDLCERSYGMGTRVATLLRRGTGSSGRPAEAETVLAPFSLMQTITGGIGALFDEPLTEYGPDRDEALDRFIAGMPREPRSLSVLHIALPHIQWEYLPDGRSYPTFRDPADTMLASPPTRPQVDRDLQQTLIQMQFADRAVGRIVKQLRANGLFGRALVIVTADHGAAYIPGRTRRILVEDNSGWILPVPLLIKYPGQAAQREFGGEVDLRDIAPTILDVLGVDLPADTAGESLLGSVPEASGAPITAHGVLTGSSQFDRVELERRLTQARAFRNARLGAGTIYALGGHADLLGTSPDGLEPVRARPTDAEASLDVDLGSDSIPAYYEAELRPAVGLAWHPVAIAVNGEIAATAVAWEEDGRAYVGVNVPPEAFRDGANEIAVFAIP